MYNTPNWWTELGWSKNVCVNDLWKILTFWHMRDKVTQFQRRIWKMKQFWKILPENTLVNCITQFFLFANTFLKVSEKLLFSDFVEKYFLLWMMSGCVLALTAFTLKTMQRKTLGQLWQQERLSNIWQKERLVTRIDQDVWNKGSTLYKKPFLLIRTYW